LTLEYPTVKVRRRPEKSPIQFTGLDTTYCCHSQTETDIQKNAIHALKRTSKK